MKNFLILIVIILFVFECFGVTKIACIGNSITYGYGLSNATTQSYPARLQALLGTTNYSVQNYGVNSTTMTKKGDTPYWTKGKLSQVFSFQPDIITIKLGTNDTKPQNWDALGCGTQFRKDYLAMIDTLAAMASHPALFLILPVPVFDNPKGASWGIRDSALQTEIPIIKEIAGARSLPIIDANTQLKKFPQFFSEDGVHPNAIGEDTLAHIVYRALIAIEVKRSTGQKPGIPVLMSRNGNITDLFDITGRLLCPNNVSNLWESIPSGSGVRIIRIANESASQLIIYRRATR